jgi:hypothetical protein
MHSIVVHGITGPMIKIYVMFVLLLQDRRRQVQNQTRRILDAGVRRPYPFQWHHHRYSLGKFSCEPPLVLRTKCKTQTTQLAQIHNRIDGLEKDE